MFILITGMKMQKASRSLSVVVARFGSKFPLF